MELFEEENVQKEKKTKNLIMLVIILLVIFIIVAAGLFMYISHLQSLRLKVVVDGVSQSAGTDTYVFAEDGTLYVSIRDFAPIAGYSYYNGEYHKYTEDTSQCNVTSSFEIASFEVNNNEYYKIQLDQPEEYQYFTASKPIAQMNGKLYAPEDAIEKAFNVALSYTSANNTISVATLNYIVTTFTTRYTNSALAGNTNTDFSIKKAALYNYVVTLNAESKLYGVSKIGADGNLVELIGDKYSSIEFIETSQDFIVTTEDNKKGLITNDGITRIRPEHDELKIIDDEYNLFLIKNGTNYGVINKSGRYIVYPEYEQIGIDKTLYPRDDIKNPYLLYDNCIPVCKNRKWGIIDRTGKMIIEVQYDSIGCATTTQRDQSINNILLVQEYEGIVVGKDKLYGLINSLGNELLPCALQEMYYKTSQGVDTAYMLYQSEELNLVDYLQSNGIVKVNTTNGQTNTTTNTVTQNTTTNTATTTNTTTNTSNVNGLQNDTTMVTNTNGSGQTTTENSTQQPTGQTTAQ